MHVQRCSPAEQPEKRAMSLRGVHLIYWCLFKFFFFHFPRHGQPTHSTLLHALALSRSLYSSLHCGLACCISFPASCPHSKEPPPPLLIPVAFPLLAISLHSILPRRLCALPPPPPLWPGPLGPTQCLPSPSRRDRRRRGRRDDRFLVLAPFHDLATPGAVGRGATMPTGTQMGESGTVITYPGAFMPVREA